MIITEIAKTINDDEQKVSDNGCREVLNASQETCENFP